MPDYFKMYAIFCAAASKAVDLIEAGETARAAVLLKNKLLEAEELYVTSEEKADT